MYNPENVAIVVEHSLHHHGVLQLTQQEEAKDGEENTQNDEADVELLLVNGKFCHNVLIDDGIFIVGRGADSEHNAQRQEEQSRSQEQRSHPWFAECCFNSGRGGGLGEQRATRILKGHCRGLIDCIRGHRDALSELLQ